MTDQMRRSFSPDSNAPWNTQPLPCPFCGSKHESYKDGRAGSRLEYHCPKGCTSYLRLKEWNTRAVIADPNAIDVSALISQRDALVEALKASQFDCNGKCPVCAGWGMSDNGETRRAHNETCIVGNALKLSEAK